MTISRKLRRGCLFLLWLARISRDTAAILFVMINHANKVNVNQRIKADDLSGCLRTEREDLESELWLDLHELRKCVKILWWWRKMTTVKANMTQCSAGFLGSKLILCNIWSYLLREHLGRTPQQKEGDKWSNKCTDTVRWYERASFHGHKFLRSTQSQP